MRRRTGSDLEQGLNPRPRLYRRVKRMAPPIVVGRKLITMLKWTKIAIWIYLKERRMTSLPMRPQVNRQMPRLRRNAKRRKGRNTSDALQPDGDVDRELSDRANICLSTGCSY